MVIASDEQQHTTGPGIAERLGQQLDGLTPAAQNYAVDFVDLLLAAGVEAGASDLHVQPTATGLELRWRVDGVVQNLGVFPRSSTADVVARLKVLANLLTYQADVPQEGRIRALVTSGDAAQLAAPEMRVSTFPTIHGERAVVRIFASTSSLREMTDLGLPEQLQSKLEALLAETSGAILVTGPAGSGKTTTLYAALRYVRDTSQGGRSIVTLEDPVESALAGIAQSQIHPASGFNFATGLRSLMRQDPEVIMVGEIRDRETAEVAFQAALTGQLLLSSFHAATAAGAISRLSDMGIAPYLLRSGLRAVVCQRLLRRLCSCAQPTAEDSEQLGLPVRASRTAVGCAACEQRGYRGRIIVAEMLLLDDPTMGRAVLQLKDSEQLEELAQETGMVTRWQRAIEAVESGQTSAAEVRRVLGCGGPAE